jgi:hypothetical protein
MKFRTIFESFRIMFMIEPKCVTIYRYVPKKPGEADHDVYSKTVGISSKSFQRVHPLHCCCSYLEIRQMTNTRDKAFTFWNNAVHNWLMNIYYTNKLRFAVKVDMTLQGHEPRYGYRMSYGKSNRKMLAPIWCSHISWFTSYVYSHWLKICYSCLLWPWPWIYIFDITTV